MDFFDGELDQREAGGKRVFANMAIHSFLYLIV